VAARGSHAPPPLAARGPTRRREIKPETGGQKWLSPLFSSSPAVTTTAICRTEKHTQTAVDFNFSFRYRSASLQISSLFPFSSLSWTGLL
jgi:hypothetical protein